MINEGILSRLENRYTGGQIVRKMLGVLVLALLLLIPLGMIQSVLYERLSRRSAAILEITESWGRDQEIVGPVLVVPYRYEVVHWEERIIGQERRQFPIRDKRIGRVYLLPHDWNAEATLHPEKRYRGIFEAVVYSGEIVLTGEFRAPDYKSLGVESDQILWDQAVVTVAIPDLRGTREPIELEWGDARYTFQPGVEFAGFSMGIQCEPAGFRGFVDGPVRFRIPFTLAGSGAFRFAPLGIQSRAALHSSWPDPAFRGAYLPTERDIHPSGFTASWSISHYGRGYAQQEAVPDDREPFERSKVSASLFGVDLITLVDSYRTVERSIKYGALFIALVFTAFFLFEVVTSLRVHPFQYMLIGAALCLFYLMLLSFSEFTGFGYAYLLAASASALLITGYTSAALRSGRKAGGIFALLVVIYAFLFVVLQLQDYALLAGSLGLFIALAVVMYATRRIDWYAEDAGKDLRA